MKRTHFLQKQETEIEKRKSRKKWKKEENIQRKTSTIHVCCVFYSILLWIGCDWCVHSVIPSQKYILLQKFKMKALRWSRFMWFFFVLDNFIVLLDTSFHSTRKLWVRHVSWHLTHISFVNFNFNYDVKRIPSHIKLLIMPMNRQSLIWFHKCIQRTNSLISRFDWVNRDQSISNKRFETEENENCVTIVGNMCSFEKARNRYEKYKPLRKCIDVNAKRDAPSRCFSLIHSRFNSRSLLSLLRAQFVFLSFHALNLNESILSFMFTRLWVVLCFLFRVRATSLLIVNYFTRWIHNSSPKSQIFET